MKTEQVLEFLSSKQCKENLITYIDDKLKSAKLPANTSELTEERVDEMLDLGITFHYDTGDGVVETVDLVGYNNGNVIISGWGISEERLKDLEVDSLLELAIILFNTNFN